jgi:hypothetical protein
MTQKSLMISQGWSRIASLRLRWKLLVITLVVLLVFFLSKGPSPGQNHFVYLADAFLHGRLGVSDGGTVLAEIVPFNGNYFVFIRRCLRFFFYRLWPFSGQALTKV